MTEGAFCIDELEIQSPLGLEDSPGVLSHRIFIMKRNTALKGTPTLDIINRRLQPRGSMAHVLTIFVIVSQTCRGSSDDAHS